MHAYKTREADTLTRIGRVRWQAAQHIQRWRVILQDCQRAKLKTRWTLLELPYLPSEYNLASPLNLLFNVIPRPAPVSVCATLCVSDCIEKKTHWALIRTKKPPSNKCFPFQLLGYHSDFAFIISRSSIHSFGNALQYQCTKKVSYPNDM